MTSDTQQLDIQPEADTRTVEELVLQVRRGLVRVPTFQRGLRWDSDDVVALFDSVYRGYPVGSFLLRKGPAVAERIKVGPMMIDAPETHSALWVVDGQQRLTALTVGLSRPNPIPTTPEDPYIVFFDARERRFVPPNSNGEVPATWVPVAQLLDASALSEWVHNWAYGSDPQLRSAVFRAGTRLRQYRIPLYIVETSDDQLLREIFYRTNQFGKSLQWNEVHDALFGHSGEHPSTLAELALELQKLGMGRPREEQLLSCLLAFKGLDVTRNVAEHRRRDQDVLKSAVAEALPAIRRVMSFLRANAEISHLRLLPRSIPLVVLTRFFHLFPEPNSRTLDLLTRWTWRLLLNAFYDERTLLRRGVQVIKDGDEEASAQKLLSLVPSERQAAFVLPSRFDARAAESRISLLGMASLRPLSIEDKVPIDIATLLEERDVSAFRKVIPRDDLLGQRPENRILLPGIGAARRELVEIIRSGDGEDILHSHAITRNAAHLLLRGDAESFLVARKEVLEDAIEALGDRLAAWSRNDRSSISYLLEQAGGEP